MSVQGTCEGVIAVDSRQQQKYDTRTSKHDGVGTSEK